MDLKSFEKKFKAFKQFEEKLPGIALGLNILQHLNTLIKITENHVEYDDNTKLLDKIKVLFYDFEDNSLNQLFFHDLNFKLHNLYMSIVYFNRNIQTNKLYSILCENYHKVYQKYKFNYNENNTLYHMINKFIHGLRVNFSKNSSNEKLDCYEFDLHKILTNFDQNYFDQNVSTEQFYVFWLDFIVKLQDDKFIILDNTKRFFSFNNDFKEDLINLMYFSFNLMLLGNNNIYDVYDLTLDDVEANLNKIYATYNQRTIESQYYINDLLVSLVISSSVSQVCAPKTINNIFIEAYNL